MKRQKQLRMSTFMVNRKENEDGNEKEYSENSDVHDDKDDSSKQPSSTYSRNKRTRSKSKSVVASIFERPKVKPKQSDLLAENLGKLLGRKPQYLTSGNDPAVSWILQVPKWFPSTGDDSIASSIGANVQSSTANPTTHKPVHDFDKEWKLHPTVRKQLKVFGRPVSEKRWSQAWGKPISYSGMIDHNDRPLKESPNLPWLIDQVNTVMKNATGNGSVVVENDDTQEHQQRNDQVNHDHYDSGLVFHPYNACLQNWYRPEDSIGLHSDDETYLYQNYPIFSVSWGGPRRFLLRPKEPRGHKKQRTISTISHQRTKTRATEPVEVWLEDGDLLIMGGACQTTHKHEVPKPRKKDPVTSNRISWTIRAIKPA